MIHQYCCQHRTISRCDYDVRTFPAAVCRVFGRGAVGGAVEQDSPPAAAPADPQSPILHSGPPGKRSSNLLTLTILSLAKGDSFFRFRCVHVSLLFFFFFLRYWPKFLSPSKTVSCNYSRIALRRQHVLAQLFATQAKSALVRRSQAESLQFSGPNWLLVICMRYQFKPSFQAQYATNNSLTVFVVVVYLCRFFNAFCMFVYLFFK